MRQKLNLGIRGCVPQEVASMMRSVCPCLWVVCLLSVCVYLYLCCVCACVVCICVLCVCVVCVCVVCVCVVFLYPPLLQGNYFNTQVCV